MFNGNAKKFAFKDQRNRNVQRCVISVQHPYFYFTITRWGAIHAIREQIYFQAMFLSSAFLSMKILRARTGRIVFWTAMLNE